MPKHNFLWMICKLKIQWDRARFLSNSKCTNSNSGSSNNNSLSSSSQLNHSNNNSFLRIKVTSSFRCNSKVSSSRHKTTPCTELYNLKGLSTCLSRISKEGTWTASLGWMICLSLKIMKEGCSTKIAWHWETDTSIPISISIQIES